MARHATDLLSLFAGLPVLVVGLLLLSGDSSAVPLEWAGPVAAIALGVLIVVAARPSRPAPTQAADDEAGREAADHQRDDG